MGLMDLNMVQEHFCRHLFEILGRFAIESFLEMTARVRLNCFGFGWAERSKALLLALT